MLKIRNIQLEKLSQGLLKSDGDKLVVEVGEQPFKLRPTLYIGADQMELIGHNLLIGRLIEVLREVFPEGLPEDTQEFRIILERVVTKANSYAIFEDRDVARYVCLAYLLGADFDTHYPASQSILIDETRPADERLTLLEFWADQLLEALSEGK
jgi:hypothetical protein